MGIEPYLISSSLVCSLSQRLARRICRHCAEPDTNSPSTTAKKWPGRWAFRPDQVKAWRGRGCVECNQKGHRGRVAIYEFFLVNEEIADLIQPGLHTGELRKPRASPDGIPCAKWPGKKSNAASSPSPNRNAGPVRLTQGHPCEGLKSVTTLGMETERIGTGRRVKLLLSPDPFSTSASGL